MGTLAGAPCAHTHIIASLPRPSLSLLLTSVYTHSNTPYHFDLPMSLPLTLPSSFKCGAGIIRSVQINDDHVGRSIDETLRLIKAFQFADSHEGEVCSSVLHIPRALYGAVADRLTHRVFAHNLSPSSSCHAFTSFSWTTIASLFTCFYVYGEYGSCSSTYYLLV